MSRKAKEVRYTEEEKRELERLARSGTEEARIVTRAKIVLGCINKETIDGIMKRVGVGRSAVGKWRDRFHERGMEGLRDEPRSGKPAKYGSEFERAVLRTLNETPPKGMSRWDGVEIAKKLGASDDAVWRVLRKHGIAPSRQRTWCVSTEPCFATKAADIVGLYINPPEKAIVISADEKPMIQALERDVGYVTTHDKKVVRAMKSTYKRHGTLNLFAALEVVSGSIRGKVSQSKKREDFIAFLNETVSAYPHEQELHVIMDNHSIHKGLCDWLEMHPNVHFHYTPTSASWLNMVEIWFGIFSRKVLRGASFSSTDDLAEKILAYIDAYPESAHPFIWRKREVANAQIRDTIANLCN